MNTTYTYETIEGVPNEETLSKILNVYDAIFEDARLDFFIDRLHKKEKIISILCLKEDTLIGFKVGYQYDNTTLYSWVGGVLKHWRGNGIGQELITHQHIWAVAKGYKKIRTKSMNRFKPMIILNLKNGFDIVNVYTNDSQQTKIIFEKSLAIN